MSSGDTITSFEPTPVAIVAGTRAANNPDGVIILQFVVGLALSPQQVPYSTIAKVPRSVTLAPKVAVALVISVTVGDVTVGAIGVIGQ